MDSAKEAALHDHVFLSAGHAESERRTWWVIGLCGAMMLLEIVGGLAFGSIALVADGLHMSTHAGALLLAALAYRYARQYARDARFSFGTGKLGDLAGFTSAIVLAMIALLIGYEALSRFIAPEPIHFAEAIPIAVLGLIVNIGSVFLLSGGDHHHHGHGHHHDHGHDHDDAHTITTPNSVLSLSVFEDGVPPVFRVTSDTGTLPSAEAVSIETIRPDGARQVFSLRNTADGLESLETIPEPHEFEALLKLDGTPYRVAFAEHAHDADGKAHHDNNMRAAIVHVLADAAVSVLVILGLILAWSFGWVWMDPLAGMIGAGVIAAWSYSLIRDTGAILLDMVPDQKVAGDVRRAVEAAGDRVADLHLWRLGPGHLGAILVVATDEDARGPGFYRQLIGRFGNLSHVTIEVIQSDRAAFQTTSGMSTAPLT
jgi:cation diffusion facilitator family transporter